jgi:hypothetical protein
VSQLDISELMTDPDVGGTTFDVTRREEVVGSNGLPTITETAMPGKIGAVFPAGDNSLVREEAYSQQQQAIEIVTLFRLRGASIDRATNKKYQPDIVVWPVGSGNKYIVRSIELFTSYGAGFIKADCVSYDSQAGAP